MSGARSIVRVRKASYALDDNSPEAVVARMEAAVKDGRLADVLANAKKLPPKAALVGEDWIKKVEARQAVDQAMAEVEGQLRASLDGSKTSRSGCQAMTRIVAFLIVILVAAAGLHWLADRPGTLVVEWQGYVAETSVFRAFILLVVAMSAALLAWSTLRSLWSSPAALGRFFNRRRQERGLDALSSGMIAIGAGDAPLAIRYAGQARKALPNEPLTHLLRAQTAQLVGDRATSRRIFEAMLSSPDTEQLGLRGLFLEAEREGEKEAARQFAERALKLNGKLGWPVEALFDLQCRAEDWQGALDTLSIAQRNNLVDKLTANRRRAVLLTGQAQAAEDTAADRALELAREAHRLAPDLVPAAAIAGRVLAAQGNTPRAARVLLKTWRSRRILISLPRMPMRVRGTARAIGSIACAIWRG